jgi:hypothetical protein
MLEMDLKRNRVRELGKEEGKSDTEFFGTQGTLIALCM